MLEPAMNQQSPHRHSWCIPADKLRSILVRQIAHSAAQTTTAFFGALAVANAEPFDAPELPAAQSDIEPANTRFKTRAELDAELLRLRAILLPKPPE